MELITAISISSFLVAGLSSAVFISLDTLTTSQTNSGTSIQTSQILDKLVTELQSAVFVSERTATTLSFTIPDQNGDSAPERIRYAWTATPGGALTRQYNGGTPQTIAPYVDLFSLTPSSKSVAETYPSLGVEDSAEMLLIDCSGSSNLGNNNVTSTSWLGQYFTMTLPAGSYAWRPTTVKIMVKKSSSPAVTRVQMRSPTASLTPSTTILEEYPLADSAMTTSYAWEQFTYNTLAPLASGGGICLVLQQQSGTTALVAESCQTTIPNLLKTSNSGTSWSLDSSHCLYSQLYGKLTTSGGTKTLNSSYLTSMAVALRPTGSTATQQSTAPLYNHPEMLSGKWELDFTKAPTIVDINGDGAMDFVVHGGGTFNGLTNNVWTTTGAQLDTNPGNDFAKTTIIDVKMQNTTAGGTGAIFLMNALRSGSNCAPISANLALQSDGTQTLTVTKKTNDSTTVPIVSITGLPAQVVSLHLIIDPSISGISITVNDVQRGTFPLTPYASSDASRSASLTASGSSGAFSYFRIRVLEQ
jgi:Tfp pilus assembly protein PilW